MSEPKSYFVPRDKQIMLLYYFDEYNAGDRFGLKRSVLKFYKDHNTNRLYFDFISVHTIYTGLASFLGPNIFGYIRLLGKARQKVDQNISNRPDAVLLQFFNDPVDGFYEGLVLYSSEGDAARVKNRPYIAVKKILVEPSPITEQEPNTLSRSYCQSIPYRALNDSRLQDLHARCMKFDVNKGILFLVGSLS